MQSSQRSHTNSNGPQHRPRSAQNKITRSELAHSLYACIKRHVNDRAVATIDTCLGSLLNAILFRRNFLIGHVAALCSRLKHKCAHAHPDRSGDSINQLPKKLVKNTCVAASLARAPKRKTPRMESPPSVKHPCITSTPESSSFAVTRLPHVSLLFYPNLFSGSCEALSLACS